MRVLHVCQMEGGRVEGKACRCYFWTDCVIFCKLLFFGGVFFSFWGREDWNKVLAVGKYVT